MARRKDPNANDGPTLTDKQRAFCHEYAVDKNGTQAAIRAGYSPATANQQASDLLAKPNIAALVDRLLKKHAAAADKRAGIDRDWVRDRLITVSDMCIDPATFNPAGANQATKLLGQDMGMFSDRLEVVDVNSAQEFAKSVMRAVLEEITDESLRASITARIEALCRA